MIEGAPYEQVQRWRCNDAHCGRRAILERHSVQHRGDRNNVRNDHRLVGERVPAAVAAAAGRGEGGG